MISQEYLLSIWIVARFFKAILLQIIYTLGFSYIIYCWFAKDPGVAVKILQKSIYIIVCIMAVYSFFELFYFFGYAWAKSVLVNVNPLLHAIEENFGWWPPLLWDSPRVRSIFPEPSQFGMYGAFVMPFIWANILNKKHIYGNLFIVCILALLMFLSVSKTSMALFLLEIGLLVIIVTIRQKNELLKKCILIIFTIGIAFGINVLCLSNYGIRPFDDILGFNNTETSKKNDLFVYGEEKITKYLQKNITGIANENTGSNGTRFAIIKNDMRVGKDHFILGVGSNLKNAYTTDYFTQEEILIPEIGNCKKLQDEQGVLKTGYPNVSEYSQRFAENGLVGLLIYVSPVFILCFIIWKNRKKYFYDDDEINLFVCVFISLIGCFVSGGSGVLTTIQTYWILLGIAFDYALLPNR
jgi:O-antigen ligase